MKNFSIQKMKESDIHEASLLMTEVFNAEGDHWTEETAKAHIEESFNPDYCYKATIEEEIVGFLISKKQTVDRGIYLFADVLVVSESLRGSGVGSSLMRKIFEDAKEKGFVGVSLFSDPKWKSYSWYKGMEFKETGWIELYKEIEY